MSGSLNKVTLIGNLGKDPEIRSTNDGKEIANFSLATSESWKDKATGEKKDKTEWHRIVCFNEGLVKVIKEYVKKGTKIYIEGQLQTRKWLDNANQEKYTTEVVLQGYNAHLVLLGSNNVNTQQVANNANQANKPVVENEELDDEIPF
jgi:single-strand DNA-binding protein